MIDQLKNEISNYSIWQLNNFVGSQGYHLIHIVCFFKEIKLLKYLLSGGLNPFIKTNNNHNILHISASVDDNVKLIRFICSNFPHMIHEEDNKGNVPIHYSFNQAHKNIDFLLTVTDLNIQVNGNNLLYKAIKGNAPYYIVKKLSICYDLTELTKNSNSYIMLASECGKINLFNLFIFQLNLKQVNIHGENIVFLLIKGKLYSKALEILRQNKDLFNSSTILGKNLFHYAIIYGTVELFFKLLAMIKDYKLLNESDINGYKPISLAICFGYTKIVNELLNVGIKKQKIEEIINFGELNEHVVRSAFNFNADLGQG